jgi:hypothetical protein
MQEHLQLMGEPTALQSILAPFVIVKSSIAQEMGKPARIVQKGDVIKCAPGVEHWHGASRDISFSCIAVTQTAKGKTTWLEPVTDKDYKSAK